MRCEIRANSIDTLHIVKRVLDGGRYLAYSILAKQEKEIEKKTSMRPLNYLVKGVSHSKKTIGACPERGLEGRIYSYIYLPYISASFVNVKNKILEEHKRTCVCILMVSPGKLNLSIVLHNGNLIRTLPLAVQEAAIARAVVCFYFFPITGYPTYPVCHNLFAITHTTVEKRFEEMEELRYVAA